MPATERAEPVAARELELASLLVDSMAASFEPAKYRDRYQENLRAVIDAKIRGLGVAEGKPEPGLAPIVNLLEAAGQPGPRQETGGRL